MEIWVYKYRAVGEEKAAQTHWLFRPSRNALYQQQWHLLFLDSQAKTTWPLLIR